MAVYKKPPRRPSPPPKPKPPPKPPWLQDPTEGPIDRLKKRAAPPPKPKPPSGPPLPPNNRVAKKPTPPKPPAPRPSATQTQAQAAARARAQQAARQRAAAQARQRAAAQAAAQRAAAQALVRKKAAAAAAARAAAIRAKAQAAAQARQRAADAARTAAANKRLRDLRANSLLAKHDPFAAARDAARTRRALDAKRQQNLARTQKGVAVPPAPGKKPAPTRAAKAKAPRIGGKGKDAVRPPLVPLVSDPTKGPLDQMAARGQRAAAQSKAKARAQAPARTQATPTLMDRRVPGKRAAQLGLPGARRPTTSAQLRVRVMRDRRAGTPNKTLKAMSLHEFAAVVTDPKTGRLNTRNRQDVGLVQDWLRAHGIKSADQRGVLGKSTVAALRTAYNRQRLALSHQQTAALKKAFYDTGVLKPGQPPPPWLGQFFHGKTPTPEELAKVLAKGGFTGDMVARGLAKRMRDPNVSFKVARQNELNRLYDSLYGGTRPGGKLGHALRPGAEGRLMAILQHPAMDSPRARAELRALFESVNYKDFARRVTRYTKVYERTGKQRKAIGQLEKTGVIRHKQAQKMLADIEKQERIASLKDAHKKPSVLGRIAHSYEGIADGMRHDIVATVIRIGHGQDPAHAYLANWSSTDDDAARKAQDYIENLDPVSHFIFEVTVDPLNAAGPLARTAGEGAVVATRAVGKGAARAGEKELFKAMERLGVRGAVADDGLKRFGKTLEHLADESFHIPAAKRIVLDELKHAPVTGHVYRVAHLATRTKTAAIAGVRKKAAQAAAHGFRSTPTAKKIMAPLHAPTVRSKAELADVSAPKASPANAGTATSPERPGATGQAPKPAAPELVHPPESVPQPSPIPAAQLEETEAAAKVQYARQARNLVTTLIKEDVSLFSNAARVPGHLSSVGASIRARYAARVRVMATHEMARQSAEDVMHKELIRVAAEKDLPIRVVGGRVADEDIAKIIGRDQALKARVLHLGEHEFNRIKVNAGTWRLGRGERHVWIALESRVRGALQMFDNAILPILQDMIEEAAARNERFLFGPDGTWLAHSDDAQAGVRAAAARTFEKEVEVENPLFGVEMSAEEMRTIVENEIDIRTSRLTAFYAREVERGNPRRYSEKWLGRKTDQIEEEATSAWKQVRGEDGKTYYVDTREKIKESALYVGHHDQALGVSAKDAIADFQGYARKLADIGLPGIDTLGSAIDREIGQLAWAAQRSHEGLFQIGGSASGVSVKANRLIADERIPLEKAILERHIAIENARADVFSRQLFNEGAFYAALQHAQSRPLRWLYYAVSAHLNIWRFVTLPLSPAWSFRNIVDNNAKALIHGVRDPRGYILDPDTVIGAGMHKTGHAVRTVFDHNLNAVLYVARVLDARFGTDVARRFEALMDTFWQHTEETIRKVMALHDIDVPEHILGQVKRHKFGATVDDLGHDLTSLDRKMAKLEAVGVRKDFRDAAERLHRMTPAEARAQQNAVQKFAEKVWDFMGTRPEDAAKRRIYRDTYYKARKKALAEGVPVIQAERRAFQEAMAKTEKVLFDYTKISVLEHNLMPMFPFIQFWRKNSAFWLRTAVEKPWVPLAVSQWEEERRRVNDDWPKWMKRYVSVKEISDVTSRVPGLHWVGAAVEELGLDGLMFDPLNLFSFRPLWAIFKGQNQLLPEDKQGWAFISPFVDAIQSAGLGINPLFAKPLASLGIINERGWRTVFPQTPLAVAFTRKFVSDTLADFLLDLDGAFADPLMETINAIKGDRLPHDAIAEQMEELIRMEMVNQLARGETPNRDKARKKIESYYLTQAIVSTFTGIYVRKATPEDIYIAKLSEAAATDKDAFARMTDREKMLLTARGHAKNDPYFDTYIDVLPIIQTYYHAPDAKAREQIKRDHPEILPYVDRAWSGDPFPVTYIQTMKLATDTETVFRVDNAIRSGHFPPGVRAAMNDVLVTPELEEFWAKNDTPQQIRDQMTKAQWYAHIRKLNKAYHSIPESDYDARREFLREHPELARSWNDDNTGADDFKLIIQSVQADLRERYFEYAEQKDWAGARRFLRDYPFTFDHFEDGRYIIDRTTGRPKNGFGKFHGTTQHARDYLAARRQLDHYFNLRDSRGKDAANKWLRSGTPEARAVLAYFAKYGHKGPLSQEAKDYLAVKKDLDYFFSLDPYNRTYFLRSNQPGSKAVRDYLAKHASKSLPKSQKARDYLAAKAALDHYFSIKDKKKRRAWLASGGPLARKARAYFDKHPQKRGSFQYVRDNSTGKVTRKWVWDYDVIRTQDYLKAKPALDHYFSIKSKQARGEWLRKGGAQQRQVLAYFDKYATPTAQTRDAKDYLAAKEALDYYFKLPKGQRTAWLESGSPLAQKALDYFARHAKKPKGFGGSKAPWIGRHLMQNTNPTQHARDYLDAKPALDLYFGMPEDARRDWLNSGSPEAKKVRDYFAKYNHAWGGTRQGMDYLLARDGLNHYFALPKEQRGLWLHSGTTDANLVLHYFKNYSQTNRVERAFVGSRTFRNGEHHGTESRGTNRHLKTTKNPRLRARLDFWIRYFMLPPSRRIAFLQAYAAHAGVFVYGVLGDQDRHDKEMDAVGKGELSQFTDFGGKTWHIKSFIDLYYHLDDPYDRELLRRGNPELAAYLDRSTHLTGDARVDGLMQRYFALPFGSALRSSFLVAHPEIQRYFDERDTADGVTAIREHLNVYFSLQGVERRDYLLRHPEIQDYFDRRKNARETFESQAEAFDLVDPRLKPYRDAANFDIIGAGNRMRFKLALQGARRHTPQTLARRTTRQPIYG